MKAKTVAAAIIFSMLFTAVITYFMTSKYIDNKTIILDVRGSSIHNISDYLDRDLSREELRDFFMKLNK